MDNRYLQIALIALNEQEPDKMNIAKKVSLKGIFAMREYELGKLKFGEVGRVNVGNYKRFEDEIVQKLGGLMKTRSSLMAIDISNDLNDLDYRVYIADEEAYAEAIEDIRATLLEDIGEDEIFLFWILREIGLINVIFSKSEIKEIDSSVAQVVDRLGAKKLMDESFVNPFMKLIQKFNQTKIHNLPSDTWKGIKHMIPAIDRSNAVFVSSEKAFPSDEERLEDVLIKLDKKGIAYEVISGGKIALLKVNNRYYELIPNARVFNKLNVHGVSFREYIG